MESLFPNTPQVGGARQSPSLLTFKAGKCNLSAKNSNGKYNVTSDKRRGTLSLSKSSDGLMHFRWTDRSTGILEDDRIIFPDEAKFLKCTTTPGRDDRIFILKLQHGTPLMFWMQEKADTNDLENAAKINLYMNNPVAADTAIATMNAAAAAVAPPTDIPGLTPEQWAAMMGLPPTGAGPPPLVPSSSAAAPSFSFDLSSLLGPTATASTPNNRLTAEDLQRAMMGAMSSQGADGERSVRLQEILNSEAVMATGILSDPTVRAALIEQLPEGQQSDEFLDETIRSPQFRQSLGQLSAALESENINSVMANFNIDPSPGMDHMIRGDGVGAFITALQADVDATTATAGSSVATASASTPSATSNNTEQKEEEENETKMDEE